MNRRSHLREPLFVAVLLAVALSGRAAAAGEPARIDIERYQAAPEATGGFAVGDTAVPAAGRFSVGLSLGESIKPLMLERENGTRSTLVGSRLGASLHGLVGVGGPLAVSLDLPLVLFQTGSLSALPPSALPSPGATLGAAAFGDLKLGPRLAILNEQSHGVDLAADAQLVLPTGRATAFATDDGLGGTILLTAGRVVGPVRVLGQVGARIRGGKEVVQLPIGTEIPLRLAATYDLGGWGPVPRQLVAEIDAATLASSPFSGETTPAEWRAGARFCLSDGLVLGAALGSGMSPAYGTPAFRFVADMNWDRRACARADQDQDGVADAADKCPGEVGPADNGGCPKEPPKPVLSQRDSDEDGIQDWEDRCPTVSGVREFQGCPPPPPPDRDEDGIFDKDDDCPDISGFAEHRGCPPPQPSDKDADGLLDEEDGCPEVPGPARYKGCPPADKDRDGVPDEEDKCADQPGTREHGGCPFYDADSDGVPDDEDLCPDDAGTHANSGCATRPLIALKKDRIETLEKILFKGDTDKLEARSLTVLDQIVSLLDAKPNIARLRIEGYTDNKGKPEALKKLSAERAEAVRAYLVGKGVAADRLTAAGLGGDNPVAPNLTPKGREANRRIEFHIETGAAPVARPPVVPAPEPVKPAIAPPEPAKPVAPPPEPVKPVVAPPPEPVKPIAPPPEPVKPAIAPAPEPVKPAVAPPPPEPAKPAVAPPPVPAKPAEEEPLAPPPPPADDDALPMPPLDDLPPLEPPPPLPD